MKTWEEIKSALDKYKKNKMKLVNQFTKGKVVECNVDGEKYYGRVNYTHFDDKIGKSYVTINPNKNEKFTWITIGHEPKSKFYDDELEQIKITENHFDYDTYEELMEELHDLDNEPLTKVERETKEYDLKRKIMNMRLETCVHQWEEVEEGSYWNKTTVGYKCNECGLRLDKDQELETNDKQFEEDDWY